MGLQSGNRVRDGGLPVYPWSPCPAQPVQEILGILVLQFIFDGAGAPQRVANPNSSLCSETMDNATNRPGKRRSRTSGIRRESWRQMDGNATQELAAQSSESKSLRRMMAATICRRS